MDIRSEILAQFAEVAQEQGKELPPLTDDLELFDSGIDSLSFAVIIARLEGTLGIDPFSTVEDAQVPITFGDLVGLYEKAASQPR